MPVCVWGFHCLSFCPCVRLCVWLAVSQSVCLCQPVCLCQSVCLWACLSLCLYQFVKVCVLAWLVALFVSVRVHVSLLASVFLIPVDHKLFSTGQFHTHASPLCCLWEEEEEGKEFPIIPRLASCKGGSPVTPLWPVATAGTCPPFHLLVSARLLMFLFPWQRGICQCLFLRKEHFSWRSQPLSCAFRIEVFWGTGLTLDLASCGRKFLFPAQLHIKSFNMTIMVCCFNTLWCLHRMGVLKGPINPSLLNWLNRVLLDPGRW